MSIERAKIDGQLVDVVTVEDFRKNPDAYDKFSAIKLNDGYIYPIRNRTDDKPGAYPMDFGIVFKRPNENQKESYSSDNSINFSDAHTMQEVIEAQKKYRDAEWSILTSPDNIFLPEPGPTDTPEMKALKEAIGLKNIDLDKYEKRFGQNYNNDKRLLRRDSITMSKLKAITSKLDMKCTLTIEDAKPDVPNPIGKSITVELNSADGDDDDGTAEESEISV